MSMIPRTKAVWQQALADAFTDPDELLHYLRLPQEPALATQAFRMLVPRSFAAQMVTGDRDDPLLRQVLPLATEQDRIPGFIEDPVGDLEAATAPGVLHKYHGRALLIATGACAIHCRYCFRRHFPYGDAPANREGWHKTLDYLGSDPSIREVILSGGDPLMLSDERLGEQIGGLEQIPHLRRLRIHSRLPVLLPKRITPELTGLLIENRLQTLLVIHCNHARELPDGTRRKLRELRGSGVTLLNQSVLLRGVNDSVEVLSDLSESLFDSGVLPYYLHLLDPVLGAAHFEVPDAEARRLYLGLLDRLPGYLVPKLVREHVGAPSKRPLSI